jgi:hypothetical protein
MRGKANDDDVEVKYDDDEPAMSTRVLMSYIQRFNHASHVSVNPQSLLRRCRSRR